MKRHRLFASVFFIFVACSSLFADSCNASKEKKAIHNKLYSITLPADWVPSPHLKGDGIVPDERDGELFHFYWLQWGEYEKPFYEQIHIVIESSRYIDNRPLSIQDVEKMQSLDNHTDVRNIKKTYLQAPAGQIRFMTLQEETDLSGKWLKSRCFYLIQKGAEAVHCISVFMLEERYQKEKGIYKTISDIFNSFIVK